MNGPAPATPTARPLDLGNLAIVPVAAEEPQAGHALVPTVPLPPPRAINRDTVTHGLLSVLTLSGAGALAAFAGVDASLLLIGGAAATSIAITAAKFFGAGAIQPELLRALVTERAALAAAHKQLTEQAAGIAEDRKRLSSESATLLSAREELDDRVAAKAEQLIAGTRQELEAERNALARERAELETKRTAISGAVAAELEALTSEQLAKVKRAMDDITEDRFGAARGHVRFFSDVYNGGYLRPEHAPLSAQAALGTLVGKGKLYVGRASLCGGKWVGTPAEATPLKSIADLRHYLRAYTGAEL